MVFTLHRNWFAERTAVCLSAVSQRVFVYGGKLWKHSTQSDKRHLIREILPGTVKLDLWQPCLSKNSELDKQEISVKQSAALNFRISADLIDAAMERPPPGEEGHSVQVELPREQFCLHHVLEFVKGCGIQKTLKRFRSKWRSTLFLSHRHISGGRCQGPIVVEVDCTCTLGCRTQWFYGVRCRSTSLPNFLVTQQTIWCGGAVWPDEIIGYSILPVDLQIGGRAFDPLTPEGNVQFFWGPLVFLVSLHSFDTFSSHKGFGISDQNNHNTSVYIGVYIGVCTHTKTAPTLPLDIGIGTSVGYHVCLNA